MAKGKKKMSEASNQEPSNPPNLWPDLPLPILFQFGRKPSLILQIYFKPVRKSWRSESTKHSSAPFLQLSHFQEFSQNEPHTMNLPLRGADNILPGYHFLGCSYGVLISKTVPGGNPIPCSGTCLWIYHLISGSPGFGCLTLPRWDWENGVPFIFSALSARPIPFVNEKPDARFNISTMIVLTGIAYPAFAYCIPGGGGNWVQRESNMNDPNDPKAQPLKLSNGIWFEGKFYALSLQGTLAVIQDVGDNDLTITRLGKKRAAPSIPCAHFQECLVESDGNIWLIFLISKSCIKAVDFVEVYELDVHRLAWVKKDDLKNKTLFVGVDCCMFSSGEEVRCKGNCIYFSSDGWWVYDLKIGSVSPCKCGTLSNLDDES